MSGLRLLVTIIKLQIDGNKSHTVLAQHKDSPVYKVQPTTENGEEGVHTLHRNMLFPLQSVRDEETTGQTMHLYGQIWP